MNNHFRCRKSCDFSIKCAWLLNAFYDLNAESKSRGGQLMCTILNEHYKQGSNEPAPLGSFNLLTKKTHCRSRSDSSMVNTNGIQIGKLTLICIIYFYLKLLAFNSKIIMSNTCTVKILYYL